MSYKADAQKYEEFVSNLPFGLSPIEEGKKKLAFWKSLYPKSNNADQYLIALELGESAEVIKKARMVALYNASRSDIYIGYNTYLYVNAAILENSAAYIY